MDNKSTCKDLNQKTRNISVFWLYQMYKQNRDGFANALRLNIDQIIDKSTQA